MENTKQLRSTCGKINDSIINYGQLKRSIYNEELNKLKNEIKKAYALKTLHVQLTERHANRMATNIQEKIVDNFNWYCIHANNEKYDHLEKSKFLEQKIKLKIELEQQIDKKREEHMLLKNEEREERMILVEVDKLREEREKYKKMHNKQQLAQQNYLESFLQNEIRKIDKDKLIEIELKESLKNDIYFEKLSERTERLEKLKQNVIKKREEAIEALIKVLMKIEGEKKERQRLLDDLVIEQVKFEVEIEVKEALLHRKRDMHKLAEDLKQQIYLKNECKKRFFEKEKEFANAVMAKIMQSEIMDKYTQEIRRQRRLEYRQELECIMKDRECASILELNKLQHAIEEERLIELAQKEEAKRTRMLLLDRHIDNVADFINQKLLYDEERMVVRGLLKNKLQN